MANSPYTVVVFSQTTGNVVPNAAVQIYNRNPDGSSGSLAVIYSDEAGANSISQPGATANAQGVFVFYAEGKAYNAVYNGFTQPIDVGLTETKVPNAIGGVAAYEFDTVANAKTGTLIGGKTVTLKVGDVIAWKERVAGLGGGAKAVVSTGTPNEIEKIGLPGGLIATIVEDVPSSKQYGCCTGGNDTAALARLDEINKTYELSEGVHLVDNFTPSENRNIKTNGYVTELKQNAGLTGDVRIILIKHSNITIDGDITLRGNISTDTGEQRHGILVQSLTANIANIQIGNVRSFDLRGDTVDIYGNTSYNPQSVSIGDVNSINGLRNAVSITGGSNINIGIITAKSQGLFALDIEPDTAGGVVKNVFVKGVFGRQVGVLGHHTAGVYKNVSIGFLDLNGSLPRASVTYGPFDTDGQGLVFRNTSGVSINNVDIYNQEDEAIAVVFSGSDVYCDSIHIENLNIGNCLTQKAKTSVIAGGGFAGVSFGTIKYNIGTPSTEIFFTGDSVASKTKVTANRIEGNGQLAKFCSINVESSTITYSDDKYCVQNLYDGSVFEDSVWSVGRISGFNTGRITFTSSKLTKSGALKYDGTVGTSWHAVEINTEVDGTWNGLVVDNVAAAIP